MIAAIYARKSTKQTGADADAKSVPRQIESAKHFAAQKGWTVAEPHVYADDAISGARRLGRNDARGGFGASRFRPSMSTRRATPLHHQATALESHFGHTVPYRAGGAFRARLFHRLSILLGIAQAIGIAQARADARPRSYLREMTERRASWAATRRSTVFGHECVNHIHRPTWQLNGVFYECRADIWEGP